MAVGAAFVSSQFLILFTNSDSFDDFTLGDSLNVIASSRSRIWSKVARRQ
jgi:hypothetical protein